MAARAASGAVHYQSNENFYRVQLGNGSSTDSKDDFFSRSPSVI